MIIAIIEAFIVCVAIGLAIYYGIDSMKKSELATQRENRITELEQSNRSALERIGELNAKISTLQSRYDKSRQALAKCENERPARNKQGQFVRRQKPQEQ